MVEEPPPTSVVRGLPLRRPSARRRPGYPLVGLRPRRARLRFTRREDHNGKGLAGARPEIEDGEGQWGILIVASEAPTGEV
jgi:hypothetical protein